MISRLPVPCQSVTVQGCQGWVRHLLRIGRYTDKQLGLSQMLSLHIILFLLNLAHQNIKKKIRPNFRFKLLSQKKKSL